MSNHVKHLIGAAALILASAAPAYAQMQEPIISFHTQKYELNGDENVFTISIGAFEDTYIDVDFGFGLTEYKVGVADIDQSTGQMKSTVIEGQVSKEGEVKIYGNPLDIDYLDLEGVYIDRLDISRLVNLDVLNLSHNLLPELDLTAMKRLSALYVEDNPFDASPLVIGADKPNLAILEMANVGSLDQGFDIADYPKLMSFDAYHTLDLRHCDPTNCPKLLRLSLDCTNVETLDVSKNPELVILNISESRIRNIDLSHNPKLRELYATHTGTLNNDCKLTSLDVSENPDLVYLFCSGNLLTELDIEGNPFLVNLYAADNYLSSISFSGSPDLYGVNISKNCMDFVTLPAVRDTFGEYYYEQRPFVFDRSYPVNGEIELGDRLNRPNSQTTAMLLKEDGTEVSDEYYSYSDGLILFHKEITDSVHFVFSNTDFTEYRLSSTPFVVKSEEDYGKDNPVVSYRLRPSSKKVALSIGMAGATPETPKTFSVDFGDGNPVEFTATTSLLPAVPNAEGDKKSVGQMTVYVPEGSDLTAFGVADVQMSTLDVSKAPALKYLSVTGCALTSIDLRENSRLEYLNLNDNSLKQLDLKANDQAHSKNNLVEVYACRNELTEFVNNENRTPAVIEVADNRLTEFSLSKTSYIVKVNVARNLLTEISLQDCEALETLDISGNNIKSLEIPEFTPLKNLDVSGNRMPLSALPLPDGFDSYTYAPQQLWPMPEKAPAVNLTDQLVAEGGNVTEFKWYTVADGRELTADDVKADGAYFTFTNIETGDVYATWTNATFPDFTGENVYRSTNITPAAPPTHVAATFTTTEDAESTIVLRSAVPGNYVYADWSGNGTLEQYKLSEEIYTIFPIKTHKDAEVKFYTYDERDGISVFSLVDVPVKNMDLSAMTDLVALNLTNDNVTADNLKLPACELTELTLSGNDISGMDLTVYDKLVTLVLQDCALTAFDAAPYQSLVQLVLSNNELTEVKLANPALWELMLVNNKLASLDLSGAPSVEQLWLSHNELNTIDVSVLRRLKVLYLDNNKFTLTTLPRILSTYSVYRYGNQALYPTVVENGYRVDLSSQLMVGSNRTAYRWFRDGNVGYLEDGSIGGDEITPGVGYTESDGVFTFNENVKDAVCLMSNAAFPELIYLSNPVDITGLNAVEGVESEELGVTAGQGIIRVTGHNGTVALYGADGTLRAASEINGSGEFTGLPSGIYFVSTAKGTAKVIVL